MLFCQKNFKPEKTLFVYTKKKTHKYNYNLNFIVYKIDCKFFQNGIFRQI